MIRSTLAAVALSAASFMVQAAPLGYNVIMGSGIGDQEFAVTSTSDVSVALRARTRYPAPSNATGIQADGSYKQSTGAYTDGPLTDLAGWNFDFSIATGAKALNGYSYRLGVAYTGGGTTFAGAFDPILDTITSPLGYFDHAFGVVGVPGLTDTATGQGLVADGSNFIYDDFLPFANLVQNSWNLGHLNIPPFDPTNAGLYTIVLQVLAEDADVERFELADKGETLAEVRITVNVAANDPRNPVPEPSSLALLGLALSGLAVVRRRAQR